MRNRVVGVLAIGLLSLGAVACGGADADRDEAGEIVSEAEVDAFNVRAGDCFNMPDGISVESVAAAPCTEPHDSQAFRLFEITGFDALPTSTEMEKVVIDGCLGDYFTNFVGVPYDESVLELTWFEPSPDTWDQLDDREIVCIVTHPEEVMTVDASGSNL